MLLELYKVKSIEPDVVSSDAEGFQVDRVPVLDDHLDRLQVSVHRHVDAGDGTVNLKTN
jgi:hypothetical protein